MHRLSTVRIECRCYSYKILTYFYFIFKHTGRLKRNKISYRLYNPRLNVRMISFYKQKDSVGTTHRALVVDRRISSLRALGNVEQ